MIDRAMKVKSPIDRVQRKRKFLMRTYDALKFFQLEKKTGGGFLRAVCIFGAFIGGIFFSKNII